MKVSSPSFMEGGKIPAKFTCLGENVSPKLVLEDLPKNSKSIAIIMDDPDAPIGVFVHWLVWDIPPEKEIGEKSESGTKGYNSFGKMGYRGPCPPPGRGPHRYFFKVFALDSMLDLDSEIAPSELERMMEGHVLAKAQLMGIFER